MISEGHSVGQTQYVSDEVLDARYFRALDRFDIRFAPTMWVFDNVRAGSRALHLACGPGMLALLKRKGVFLAGVDPLKESANTAHRNGYDATCESDLTLLPFAANSFDYVVSFDLFSALDDEQATAILAESKRVLRPNGVSMHTISCDLLTDTEHIARFAKLFQHVAVDPRYSLCLSVEAFLEQAEHNARRVEPDFVEFLRGLSFKERRAFDLAVGYLFSRASDLAMPSLTGNTHLLLKASDAPPGPFYNEHRDRRALFSSPWIGATESGLCLDRSGAASFNDGWSEPAMLPPVARWIGAAARVRFPSENIDTITFDVMTLLPDLRLQPAVISVSLNGVRVADFSLLKTGWFEVVIVVPANLNSKSSDTWDLELHANRTAELRELLTGSESDREVSVAVCNLTVHA